MGVYLKEEAAAGSDPALESLRTVMWFVDNSWWITSIQPAIPVEDGVMSWLARGSRFPAFSRDPADMSDIHWSFPAANSSGPNKWVRCQPKLEASLRADELVVQQLKAELATALSSIKEKDDAIAALELAASSWKSWGDYQPSGLTSGQPDGYAYGSSSTSSTWKQPWAPPTKGGWMNKMIAMLSAIHLADDRRIEHLARVSLGCMYKLKR